MNRPQRFFFFFLSAAFFITALYFSFPQVLHELKGPIPFLFDLKPGSSWIVEKKIWQNRDRFLTQRLPAAREEPYLLSKDIWRDYNFVLLIEHPRLCGIVLSYSDEENYDYFFYNPEQQQLITATMQNGTKIIRQVSQVSLGDLWPLQIKVENREAGIFYNAQLLMSMKLSTSEGKIGLLAIEASTPRIQFYQFYIGGETSEGPKTIGPSALEAGSNPSVLFILYSSLIGLVASLKGLYDVLRRKERVKVQVSDLIFTLAASGVGAPVFVKLAATFGRLEPAQFHNPFLWQCLAAAFLGYSLIYLLAVGYQKVFDLLSIPLLFAALPFLIYTLSLINLLTFKIDDTFFLRMCLGVFIIPPAYKIIREKIRPRWKDIKLYPCSMMDWLIFLVIVQGLLYCLESNFDLIRTAQGDEKNLWFIAAENIIKDGMLAAHLTSYPSGILYSLGIPFVWAFPGKLLGIHAPQIIFFSPIFITMALLIFLDQLRARRWCFLFFYLAVFDLINNHGSWITVLFYSLLYGEALAALFFLFLVYEIRTLMKSSSPAPRKYMAAALAAGLLSLSKIPLSCLSPILAGIILIIMLGRVKSTQRGWLAAAVLALSFLPIVIWKIFSFIMQINNTPVVNALGRVHLSPQGWQMLGSVWEYIRLSFSGTALLAGICVLFIILRWRGREWLLMVPFFLFLTGFYLYYGLVYTQGDQVSSIRYLLTVVPALFYLGADSFSDWIDRR